MHDLYGTAVPNLWDMQDQFYYDVLREKTTGNFNVIRLRSLVGLIPIFAVAMLDMTYLSDDGAALVQERIAWFKKRHPEMFRQAVQATTGAGLTSFLLALTDADKLRGILKRAFDESEFLSPHGIRGLSRSYNTPYSQQVQGDTLSMQYEPAEAPSDGPFGGNSNWRGPVWFPINYLLIDVLRRLHYLLPQPTFTVEYPTGSGTQHNLEDISKDLASRLVSIFEVDGNGNRPVYGGTAKFQTDPRWNKFVLFYEYFHGENGAGLGASHQTGWTGLVAELLRLI